MIAATPQLSSVIAIPTAAALRPGQSITLDGSESLLTYLKELLVPVVIPDDLDLVKRSQAGDRDAFEVLVSRHAERIYSVVLRFTGNQNEAEDITQETFLRAWRNINRFEGRSKFFTWLYRIGINEAKRRLGQSHQRSKATKSLDDDEAVDIADWRDAPEPRAHQNALEAALRSAIADLPADHRLPLILRDIEGLSTTESAEVMKLSTTAFKSRLHRARMTVREQISDFLPGEEET